MSGKSVDNDMRALLIDLVSPTPGQLDRLQQRLAQEAAIRADLDIAHTTMSTPIGSLLLAATDQGLVRVAFERENHDQVLDLLAEKISPRILRAPSALSEAVRQLTEYFSGTRTEFDLPLDFSLSSGFRRLVQQQLPTIAYGHTGTYRDIAESVGNPKAVRAVGTACATNPLPVVIPCHRILRSDGSVGGYAGGSAAKSILLNLERGHRG